MLHQIGLRSKMLMAFLIVALFVFLVATAAFIAMKRIHTEYDVISKTVVNNLKTINEIGTKTQESGRFLLLSYMAMFKGQLDIHKSAWENISKEIEAFNKNFEKNIADSKERAIFEEFNNAWKEYHTQGVLFMDHFGQFDEESSMKALIFNEKQLNPGRQRMNEAFQKLFNYHAQNAQEKGDTAYSVYVAAVWTMIGLSALAVLCAFVIGWQVSQYINVKMGQISKDIMLSSEGTLKSSQELSSASAQLSRSANDSASSLEETASSLEELSSMVKLNSDHAKEANALSQISLVSAESGEQEIKKLIASMNEMSNSSKKIEGIINVIDDIAFQTNLLALNAAVEAARAGEQGKGFAVVAEAVRSLAFRSASAAKDISGLIKGSVSQTDEGTVIADKSGVALKEILVSIKKVAELNSEISAASSEQANGIEQISKAMNKLDHAIQTNAVSAKDVAQSASHMSDQSETLAFVVSELNKFIKGSAAGDDEYA